eukprot:8453198-Alexandrium_andersonii.AAC.1
MSPIATRSEGAHANMRRSIANRRRGMAVRGSTWAASCERKVSTRDRMGHRSEAKVLHMADRRARSLLAETRVASEP